MARVEPEIVEQIAELIVDAIDKDQRLPTEQEMMDTYKISRFSLREVLNYFEVNGMITSQQGSGRMVHYPDIGKQIKNVWFPLLKFKPSLLLDFWDVRRFLELSAIPVVIKNLRSTDLLELHEIVSAMIECAERGESFDKYDRDFHCRLFMRTENVIFQQLLTAFWDLCEQTIRWPESGNNVQVAKQHAEILEALACQDEKRAVELMTQQLIESRNRVALALISGRKV